MGLFTHIHKSPIHWQTATMAVSQSVSLSLHWPRELGGLIASHQLKTPVAQCPKFVLHFLLLLRLSLDSSSADSLGETD